MENSSKAITAIYAGTFDPITNGHSDLLRRASKFFDHIILAVASNEKKKPLFTLEERMELAKIAHKDEERVSVKSFDILLTDYAAQQGATVLLRGLRAVSDFEYEFQLASMNRTLRVDLESVYLMPAEKYAFVSSSLVKEVASLGGDVSSLVHPEVFDAMRKKYNLA